MRPVASLYASLPAADFGPVQVKAIHQHWLDRGTRCRKSINAAMGRVKPFAKWSVAEGLPEADERLKCVEVRNTDAVAFINRYDHAGAMFSSIRHTCTTHA